MYIKKLTLNKKRQLKRSQEWWALYAAYPSYKRATLVAIFRKSNDAHDYAKALELYAYFVKPLRFVNILDKEKTNS